jgi:hypothetical protein
VRPGGRLEPGRLREALYQTADALSAIHRLGKVHRDVKPSNILVEDGGRVVLLDYGLVTDVRVAAPDRTHDAAIVGTPAYMSPEQALDEPLGPPSDWYSLGVVLYEALAGARPFDGSAHAMVARRVVEPPAPPRTHDPGIDRGLEALCLALLHREPAERAGAREVMAALGRAPSAATMAVEQAAAIQPFVGRARELAVLREAFDEARCGGGVQVVVTGPSGIGKTTLIQAFLDTLGDDALVLHGRCYERETVPCQAIDGLVDALAGALLLRPADGLEALLPPDVAVLARRFPALDRVPVLARTRALVPPDPGEQRRRALRAFAELVWRLAGRRTPVFFVDDLPWGDGDSTGALADVLRHLAAVGALFVASSRGAPASLPGRRIELALAPLPVDDAAALVATLIAGDPQAGALSAELARDSAGVPVFLVELARAAARRRDPDLRSPAVKLALAGESPATLEQLLDERLRELPPETRRLLEVCAVAARPLALDVAATAAPCGDPAAALSRLRVEHLLRAAAHGAELWIEPYHDRIRDAVAAPLSPEAVRGIHGRLADALDGRAGTTAAQRVAHRLAAGDAVRARALARPAAAEAEAAFAFHRAAELYRLALDAEDLSPADRRALVLRRIECLASAGRPAEGVEAAATAAAGVDGAECRELRRLEIECRLRCRDAAGGVAASRALLAEIGVHLPTGRTATLAALLAGRLRLRLRVRGLGFTRRAAADLPVEALERIDVMWAMTNGLNQVNPVLSALVHTHHLRAALAAGEPGRVARALCGELPRLAIADRGGRRLAAMTERVSALAAELELPELTAILEATLCYTSFLIARWRAAADHGARAEQLIRDHVRGRWLLSVIHLQHVYARWCLGETGWIVEHMPGLLAEAEQHGDLHTRELLAGAGSNVYWLILGQPDEARAMAPDPRPRRDGAAPFHLRDYDRLQSHARADLYKGAGRAALDRVEQAWPAFQRSLVWRFRPIRIEGLSLRAGAAVAAAAAAPSAERPRLLALARQAAGQLAAEPLPWAHAFAAAARAGAAHAADPGDPGLPALLDAAAAAATAAEMHLLARAVRHRRGAWCGEPALAADVEAALRRERIADPAAIVRLLVPG